LALPSIPSSSTYVTNGLVTSVVVDGSGRVYLAGGFSQVGPRIGHGLSLTTSDDQPAAGWPDVNGQVDAVTSDGSGGWFIGGEFSYVGGVARNGLAHIESDGTVDPSWDPDVTGGAVDALAVSGSKLFVGGSFSSVGGQALANLAEVSTTGAGAADASWDPEPSCNEYGTCVDALVVSGSELFVGGAYSAIGGQALSNLAQLSTLGSGAADTSWDPDPNAFVYSFVLSGSDLFVGGSFTTIGGQSRSLVAELSTTGAGAADATWNPNPGLYKDQIDGVYAMALSGTDLFVGGIFGGIGGQPDGNLAELSTEGAGAADPSWDPSGNESPTINALAVSSGELYVAGSFGEIGGARVDDLARVSLTGTGTADANWNPNVNNNVDALGVAGSDLYAGGAFTSAGSLNINRDGLARLNPDGTLDQTWDPTFGGFGSLQLSSAELYDAGGSRILRFPTAGTGDSYASWELNSGDDSIDALALSGDELYVGGVEYDDPGSGLLVRLSTTGTGMADPSWNPDPNGEVNSLAVSGSALYASGEFTSIGGQSRDGIAKLSTTGMGAADPTWNPNPTFSSSESYPSVGPLALSSNSLYVAGYFTSIGGQTSNGLADLSTTGTGQADPTWDPDPNGSVSALAVSGSDLYVGGYFTMIGGLPRSYLAGLSLTGTGAADPSWDPDADDDVRALATSGNGLVAAGDFSAMGPLSTQGVAVFGDISLPAITLTTPTNGATYTPGQSVSASYSCSDPGGVVALASCDGPIASGQAVDTSTPGRYSFAVTATDADGNTSTQTASYAVAGPPSATTAEPAHNPTYTLGQFARATYSCQEASYGPGLQSCVGTVPDGAPIDTATAGQHQFAVTATSTDGQTSTQTVNYTVLPSNHFGVSDVKPHPNGNTDLVLSVPGPGVVDVMETAWDDDLASAADLPQPATARFVIARKHINASRAGKIQTHVTLNPRGETLLRHHRYRVVFRLWISYTPTGGQQRNIGIYGLHFSR
jgi:trimeric autotransporter adhesin